MTVWLDVAELPQAAFARGEFDPVRHGLQTTGLYDKYHFVPTKS